MTTVANSGTCYDLTLVDKIKNVNGKTVLNNKAKVRNKVNIKQSSWDAVHKGMNLVVNGSRSSISFMFKNVKATIAGKTGTAQQSKFHANHAYFISYAPYQMRHRRREMCINITLEKKAQKLRKRCQVLSRCLNQAYHI